MRKLDKTETLATIGDMTYVREVTKPTCIVVYVYISNLTQLAYFLSLFGLHSVVDTSVDFHPYFLGTNLGNRIFFLLIFFLILFFFCHFYYSANSTLLSLLRFSYFITPYDAQASSLFSALIIFQTCYFNTFTF